MMDRRTFFGWVSAVAISVATQPRLRRGRAWYKATLLNGDQMWYKVSEGPPPPYFNAVRWQLTHEPPPFDTEYIVSATMRDTGSVTRVRDVKVRPPNAAVEGEKWLDETP